MERNINLSQTDYLIASLEDAEPSSKGNRVQRHSSKFVLDGQQAMDAEAARAALLLWGGQNFRAFQWRLTDDPYRVLVAEIMLHRTQAAQVSLVYPTFIEKFPDIGSLADSGIGELAESMWSLGLRWRVALMRDMAEQIVRKFDGRVPQSRDELVSLPGVSDYIATAVRCFAWGFPEALIDTNTVRVLGRVFGLDTRDSSRRSRIFRSALESMVDRSRPRDYNFALLDLAHLLCTKRREPDCDRCPLRFCCVYGLARVPSPGSGASSLHCV